jgi:DNA-binding NarL/FixJ family response regulator
LVVAQKRPRVLLADDHVGILNAVQRLLESSCDVVGLVTTGLSAVAAVQDLKPDVVILDISMPDVSGLETCRRIKAESPETRVVILTAFGDADLQEEAMNAGASALVLKQSVDDLLRAVQGA